ncbi:peptidase C25 [Thermoplasmatales archaeon ex4484_30]|nr:MAG: peptidase C25 [Thermoplasmatales archaeon ex4484_30]
MKKIFTIVLCFMLIAGGISVVATNSRSISENIHFPFPKFEDGEQYLRVIVNDSELYIMSPGKPLLPRILKVVELPFGVKNVRVTVIPKKIEEIIVSKEIKPAPSPAPLSSIKWHIPPRKDRTVYGSREPFPPAWYSYRVGCGLNGKNEHVTFVTINLYPIRYIPADGTIYFASDVEIRITYEPPAKNIIPKKSIYDLAIIAPSEFSIELQRLVEHKNEHNVKTILKTTEEIYAEYSGRDKPEKIKYFIKDAIEEWGIKYVLLVGGLKSLIYAKPRDNANCGEKDWHVPVRYSNLISGEPGYLCDLYYADVYKEGGEFDDWDSNGNGIFAEWTNVEGMPEDTLDLYPDVCVGRLACRNIGEVKDVIDKIIYYENNACGSEWFNRILVVSGDGFLDQQDWNIQWNTNGLPDGEYTIYAQSINDEGEAGYIDEVHITIDRSKETKLTFSHDDHLNPSLQNGYPAPPIAEIVSVSDGDVLGGNDYTYTPSEWEAYCNELFWWANITYIDGVLYIRGKSYDPKPYGNITSVKVWIEDSNGEVVFEAWRNNTEMYYEGEWVTGEKLLHGRGGALYYMPDDFEKEILWTSNGKYTGMDDVIEAFSKGYGLAFFSGHGSPGFWGDHLPGIPGNRQNAQLTGLVVSQVRPYFPFIGFPFFPMKKLANTDKLPVVVVGGCHNSMFNVSAIPTVLDIFFLLLFGKNIWMHTYGQLVPECWAWYIIKLERTGAIATMGNTGYGWGWEGEWCTIGGGDGWITSEFFRQYGEKGYDILGTAYAQTITTYIHHFKEFTLPECWWYPDLGWDWVDEKTVQQWVLLGDPSLKMGGYS